MSFAQNLGDPPALARGRARGDPSEHLISTTCSPVIGGPWSVMNGRSERRAVRNNRPETHSGFKRRPGPVKRRRRITSKNKREASLLNHKEPNRPGKVV